MSVWRDARTGEGSVMADCQDRRSHRRVPLRLPVASLGDFAEGVRGGLFTTNVSPGGMLVRMPVDSAPRHGQEVRFELTVPPGEGYSVAPCLISGQGKVVRTDPGNANQCEVAVRFTQKLSLGV
ncbi:MAG: PilZ domain-containing protein [Phycisphaerae bacterium]